MAVTKTSGYLRVESTATQLVAANSSRRALMIEVEAGEVWIGPDNTVAADDGYRLIAGEKFTDSIPTTDAYYAVTRSGRTAKMSWLEASDA